MDHDAITNIITRNRTVEYGVGITPNPFVEQQSEWVRRHKTAAVRKLLTEKIESIFEPRFITPPETSECIEAIITMTDSRNILELGTCTGFTTYHMARAICGKAGAKVVSIDARPAHDRAFWAKPEVSEIMHFVEGWTPGIIATLAGQVFDLVFVDSDHTADHTNNEMVELWKVTQRGTVFLFHDVPEWRCPSDHNPAPVRKWLYTHARPGQFLGCILPTCEQLDCLDAFGPGYPKQCNPHLGIFIRD